MGGLELKKNAIDHVIQRLINFIDGKANDPKALRNQMCGLPPV
ncbi:MAG TPA: hypothetical protein VHJ99_09535 [Candidatus Dormibacteraeota bacterium]|nr:hypothetical protein [Candidatus Dormibacteraeota bacterium]